MIKSSLVGLITVAICFSPVAFAEASEEDLTAALTKCIDWQEAVRDLQTQLEKKDREILTSYSHYEVAARNAERMNRAYLADKTQDDVGNAAFEWEVQKSLKFEEAVDGMYSRKLKTQRLRNMLVEGSSCKSYRFPKKLVDTVCATEDYKDKFYCQTNF